jgi:hypothetical protein
MQSCYLTVNGLQKNQGANKVSLPINLIESQLPLMEGDLMLKGYYIDDSFHIHNNGIEKPAPLTPKQKKCKRNGDQNQKAPETDLRITTHGTAPWFSKFRSILTLYLAPPPLPLFTFLYNLTKTGISIVGCQTSEERLRNELKFSDEKKYLHACLCTYCTKRNTQSHTQTQRMLVHKSVKSKTEKRTNKTLHFRRSVVARTGPLVLVTSWSSQSL